MCLTHESFEFWFEINELNLFAKKPVILTYSEFFFLFFFKFN